MTTIEKISNFSKELKVVCGKEFEFITTNKIDIYDVYDYINKIEKLLVEKNRKYGDAALTPLNVFSSLNSTSSILIRLDDKLSRLLSDQNDDDEDIILDILGYLFLLGVSFNYSLAEKIKRKIAFIIDIILNKKRQNKYTKNPILNKNIDTIIYNYLTDEKIKKLILHFICYKLDKNVLLNYLK